MVTPKRDLNDEHRERFSVDPLDAAYAAGLIDGEGYVTIALTHNAGYPNPVYRGRIAVNMTTAEPLQWMLNTFGGSYFAYKTPPHPNHRPMIRWELQGRKVVPFLEALLPHFKLKHRQAELILKLYTDHHGAGQRAVSSEELARRAAIKAELDPLNRRGLHEGD